MRKGTKHDPETKLKIKQSMAKHWEQKKTQPRRKLSTLSTLLSRAAIASKLGKQFGGDRDLYDVLGYKSVLTFDHFSAKYERQDIASRIVDAPCQSTWRRTPIVYDNNSKNLDSEFELAFNKLASRLRLFHYLERVDRLSGIGRYGLLLIGIRGRKGQDLRTPLVTGLQDESDISYLSVYTEGSVDIETWVTDQSSPFFGRPETYRIDLTNSDVGDIANEDVIVHHTRVLHVAEGVSEDDVYGKPRLQTVYNLLDDLEKVVGGSAEMFWQGAYRGLHIDINPDFQAGDLADSELSALNDEIDDFVHGLRRVIRTQGVNVNTLKAQIADPSGVFNVIMDLISGASKIPKRILFGSERGELASSQDEINWNARITERQLQFAEPVILRAFIDKMIAFGVLPRPKNDEYKVLWPSLFELDDLRKAQAVWTWARAAEKLADAVAVQILSKEQAFQVLDIPGLVGFAQLADTESDTSDSSSDDSSNSGVSEDANDDYLSSEDVGQEPDI